MSLDTGVISAQVAAFLDATLLKPQAVESEIIALCSRARQLKVRGVCVSASWLPLVVRELTGTAIKPVCVVGFPTGATSTAAKVFEAQWCEKAGARELDMVVHLGHVKAGQWAEAADDIKAVIGSVNVPVKVIFEAQLLTPDEILRLCQICEEAGAAFVKTSTGFTGGARLEDVKLMRAHFTRGVKASGGIRGWEAAQTFIEAGVNCIGTSSEAIILSELEQSLKDAKSLKWFENNPLPPPSL